jgi:L-glutamine-phosphate cytidylyltransferase
VKAIILAAGRGSRMKSLTDDRPKCLVEFRGRTLLEWQLKALDQAGITEVAIVTGYKRELLINKGLVEFHNPKWVDTQMVSSLEFAKEWLQNEICIVSYSDIFYNAKIVRTLIDCSADIAVAFDPNWLKIWQKRFNDPLDDAETFQFTDDLMLNEIGKKPNSIDEINGQYMGLIRYSPKGWAEVEHIRSQLMPLERDHMHMTGLLQKVIEANLVPIQAVPCDEEWGEIDSVDDLKAYL